MPILVLPILVVSSCYYEVLIQKSVITVLELTVSRRDCQDTLSGNHCLLGTSQPEDVLESNYKNFYPFVDFCMTPPPWYTGTKHTACSD